MHSIDTMKPIVSAGGRKGGDQKPYAGAAVGNVQFDGLLFWTGRTSIRRIDGQSAAPVGDFDPDADRAQRFDHHFGVFAAKGSC